MNLKKVHPPRFDGDGARERSKLLRRHSHAMRMAAASELLLPDLYTCLKHVPERTIGSIEVAEVPGDLLRLLCRVGSDVRSFVSRKGAGAGRNG